jgi:glycosyltransferase involved in cell wall biosynthesis
MKIAVAQLGARMHYAVPRIFAGNDSLDRLYTDLYAGKGIGGVLSVVPPRLLPPGGRKLAARTVAGFPNERVTAFGLLGFRYWSRLRSARTPRECAAVHLWAGDELGRLILRHGLGEADTLYTYNSASLRLLRHAREHGIRTLYEQTIAPVAVELELMTEEYRRWPDWEDATDPAEFYGPFLENEREEWALADRLVCGSAFVAEGIRSSGGPAERTRVVPYGVTPPADGPVKGSPSQIGNRPLRVLTVGTVGLRKGAPYLAAAAKALVGRAEFRLVGPVALTRHGCDELRSRVELVGAVPRSEVAAHFAWADVFLLPSLCEGSATATYEALSHGLPVVTTFHSGSPVIDGEQGFIVPIREVDPIVASLERLASDPERLAEMSRAAVAHSRSLTLAAYGTRLIDAVQE